MIKIPLIAVVGATASGKTGLAIDIAEKFDGEIVSADSMQIYKYMDIGSAKPTKAEQKRAVHHMIDFIDPKESFSAADYAGLAHKCIADIMSRKKTAVLCGGTGLYVNSVINDVDFAETKRDDEYRQSLFDIAEKEGNEYLHNMLAEKDPKSAKNIHANNVKRVVRALEFYNQTGKRLSEHKDEADIEKGRYNPVIIGIEWDRTLLYERINARVDMMIAEGLTDEVNGLKKMGLNRDMQSMQGIGYKEMFDYLDGKIGLNEAVELIKMNSRRYAKRQLTWFRRDKRIYWIPYNCDTKAKAEEILIKNGYIRNC